VSIFYRDALSQAVIEKQHVDPGLVRDLSEAKRHFASSYVDKARESIDSFGSVVYPFSHLIFTYVGFSMEPQEVVRAWEPIKGRINFSNLQRAIFREVAGESPADRFLKAFDFIEIISLEGAILARLHGSPKVLP
jgi:hypothetical protein